VALAPHSVYTILRPERLDEIAKRAKPTTLRETKRWVTAKTLFDEAHERGEEMAVLYADAANDCSKLLYWGKIGSMEVDARGTSYSVNDLVALSRRRTQELVLRSTEKNIAENFLRPYAVVRTPSFVKQKGAKTAASESVAPTAHQASVPSASRARPQPAATMRTTGTTLFSFGYWGCGSATPALVEAVDAAEAERGFEPPLWIDIRISRSVHAAGFRDKAFEGLLGPRYVWMSDLGNMSVLEHTTGIRIKNPAAANELLEHALEPRARRVIFFCSCEIPGGCHRHTVGTLVIQRAKARNLDVTVIEWPGGEPSTIAIDVPLATLRKIKRGNQTTLLLPTSMTVGAAAALPWCTIADLRAGAERRMVLVGPAHFDVHGSHLKILQVDAVSEDSANEYRAKYGYGAINARGEDV
jgi:hypothetical protein